MNRINQKGMDLIQYKAELMKDYPKIVKDSLILALETKVESNVLDMDTYLELKNDENTVAMFEEYLLSKPQFQKTDEEIFQEFEVIRLGLNEKLSSHGLEGLYTESVIDKDLILISKKFCINEEFTMSYFGVRESDLLKLMKRKGFIEKFAVLRLTAIFDGFIQSIDCSKDLFNYDKSYVYFDKEENGYSIDLYFEIPVEEVEMEDKISSYCDVIKEIAGKAEEYYKEKTVA
ncbi:hypothetical protein NDS46_31205 (plasmid) [Paenibacillus thiaminolyticus]|uniref:hypothetical protein n=1 Tax=Paenibacillus thiaminolyticus TaxID=49283 RepID=UPI00232E9021|nr:hypothetical protein [Paenibacillus thiaminolyticus]WCF11427.1 hypothetical protein NDS46_31205 [Paenibacillus thiaminolyticus]